MPFLSLAASVLLQGGALTGVPAKQHRPQTQAMEVLDAEDCDAKVHDRASLDVPLHCGFVRGSYRYSFVENETGPPREVSVEFSVTRNGPRAFALLVGEPDERAITP
jgi:hypothetical protein